MEFGGACNNDVSQFLLVGLVPAFTAHDVGGGDEGLLHGQGTGQSDGIMGLIEGEQGQEPVRLAESEFVIPADVVSALGDGSTKAGAKALYDMINRIRMQAHGHIKQSNPVNPAEVLPA